LINFKNSYQIDEAGSALSQASIENNYFSQTDAIKITDGYVSVGKTGSEVWLVKIADT
jgi:hypothetical protein